MQVTLFDRLNQESILAEINAMTDCHVQNLKSSWIPAFRQRYQAQERDEDFSMWNTGNGYFDLLIHRKNLSSFALIAENNVQGVLLLQRETQPSYLEPNCSLIYVRYLATAPWNRRDKSGPGQFRGVGTLLMAWALQESQDAGCDGRLGLHSQRGSDEFYRRLGLHNLGLDAAHRGMNYFELRCSRATEFSEAVKSEAVVVTL